MKITNINCISKSKQFFLFMIFSWEAELNALQNYLTTMSALNWNDTHDWKRQSLRNILACAIIIIRCYGVKKNLYESISTVPMFLILFKKCIFFERQKFKWLLEIGILVDRDLKSNVLGSVFLPTPFLSLPSLLTKSKAAICVCSIQTPEVP